MPLFSYFLILITYFTVLSREAIFACARIAAQIVVDALTAILT